MILSVSNPATLQPWACRTFWAAGRGSRRGRCLERKMEMVSRDKDGCRPNSVPMELLYFFSLKIIGDYFFHKCAADVLRPVKSLVFFGGYGHPTFSSRESLYWGQYKPLLLLGWWVYPLLYQNKWEFRSQNGEQFSACCLIPYHTIQFSNSLKFPEPEFFQVPFPTFANIFHDQLHKTHETLFFQPTFYL